MQPTKRLNDDEFDHLWDRIRTHRLTPGILERGEADADLVELYRRCQSALSLRPRLNRIDRIVLTLEIIYQFFDEQRCPHG